MAEFDTEVLDVIKRTANVKSFRLKNAQGADFKAGQFLSVTIKVGDQEGTKYFSFSSSPTETGYIEFTKKLTDSEYSKALDALRPGDRAKIKMPLGSFTVEGADKKIAFLSGGIGITPVRSICKYAVDRKLDIDIALLYANRRAKDIIFREDLDAMQKAYAGLKVTHILSGPDKDCSTKTGPINAGIIKEDIPDFSERKFYVCGPPPMVEAMKNILENELHLERGNIVTEKFMGY